jgi:hypothetical protein
MAAKRQSFLDKLEKELPEQPKATTAPELEVRAATPLTRSDIHKTTIYVPVAVHDRLREIAFTERKRVHDLIMEGLDRVMESRGHAERTGDKKPS